jgi:taurine dioxygenase
MKMTGPTEKASRLVPYPRPQVYRRPQEPYAIGDVEVVPSEGALGAEICGIDFSRSISDGAIEALHEAWADHAILLWRGQKLEVKDHMRVGKMFGELEEMQTSGKKSLMQVKNSLPPEILVIDNEPELNRNLDAAPVDYRQGMQSRPLRWHSDNSYRQVPPRGSLFYMRVAPPAGGITHFLNMYEAYNKLPNDLLSAIKGRWSKHDPTLNSAGSIQAGLMPPADVSSADNVEHPLARIHDATGRIALYLGRRQYQYICGLSIKESNWLLDRLWLHAQQEEFIWRRQDQRAGDLILWDNRCAMHSRDQFDPDHRRIAHRIQLAGVPIDAPWPRIDV